MSDVAGTPRWIPVESIEARADRELADLEAAAWDVVRDTAAELSAAVGHVVAMRESYQHAHAAATQHAKEADQRLRDALERAHELQERREARVFS